MICNCPPEYTLVIEESAPVCRKTVILADIVCPPGCTTIMGVDGNARCSCLDEQEPTITSVKTSIDMSDTSFFKEVSFTVAYKPTEGRWISYYSMTPDFYVAHQQHFQQGSNYGRDGGKLWSHLLGNTSYQVINGRLEPFIVEFPNVNQNTSKLLSSISLEVESRRWQQEYDFSVMKGIGFNKVEIYNTTNNSGTLILNELQSIRDIKNYPRTNVNNTQDITYSSFEGKHTFNYFFNRVINQNSNIPQWIWDSSMVNKEVNSKAISFSGKRVLERIRGEYAMVRLTNDKESRFQISLNKVTNSEIIE